MFAWLLPVLNFLGGPVVGGVVKAYQAKLTAGNTEERIAADLASREITIQQRELELNNQLKVAEIGKWYEPEHLFGYTMVIYFSKIVLWDKVFASFTNGTTDPISGAGAEWAGMIMMFYVGMRGFQNIARIIKR